MTPLFEHLGRQKVEVQGGRPRGARLCQRRHALRLATQVDCGLECFIEQHVALVFAVAQASSALAAQGFAWTLSRPLAACWSCWSCCRRPLRLHALCVHVKGDERRDELVDDDRPARVFPVELGPRKAVRVVSKRGSKGARRRGVERAAQPKHERVERVRPRGHLRRSRKVARADVAKLARGSAKERHEVVAVPVAPRDHGQRHARARLSTVQAQRSRRPRPSRKVAGTQGRHGTASAAVRGIGNAAV